MFYSEVVIEKQNKIQKDHASGQSTELQCATSLILAEQPMKISFLTISRKLWEEILIPVNMT